jgi:hypothetical protein
MSKKLWFSACFVVFVIFRVFPSSAAEPAGYASVSGTIKDNFTRQTLSGVKIKIKSGSSSLEAFSNASGYYNFPRIPLYYRQNNTLGEINITVTAQDYVSDKRDAVLALNQQYAFDFFLEMRFNYPVIQGRVTDSVSSAGIPQAVVSVKNDSDNFTGQSDNDGYYKVRVENKGVGLYEVTAEAEGHKAGEPRNIKTFPKQTYTFDFALEKEGILGISVSPDTWQIVTPPATSKTIGNPVTVTNTGTINTTYSLMLRDPDGWASSQSQTGPEQYILNAKFADNAALVDWSEANHALSTSAVRASVTQFAGGQTGVDVAPNETRLLWLQFKAPSSTAIFTEQNIEVIINAELP